MREFTLDNGIDMVEGKLYNWRKAPVYYGEKEPYNYAIDISQSSYVYTALYFKHIHILSFARITYETTDVYRFYCKTIYDAEKIVQAYCKGNKTEPLPIFVK